MIKNLTTGATEQAFTFDSCQYLWVKNTGDSTVYISPYSNIVAGADNVATLVSGDAVRIPAPANKLYTLGQGTLAVHAINTEESPFKSTGKGGGSGDGVHFRGSTTTALTDGATTNPITIDGSSYTAVMGDMVIYGNKEFLFDGTAWHEMGDLSDTVGRKYYVSGVSKGEIFNSYTGNRSNVSSGSYSHAEGWATKASGQTSHVEGQDTIASATASHAEGIWTTASGDSSHAEGWATKASGTCSHAEGYETIASGDDSHVSGKYNDFQTGDLFEIGNGTADNARSNIVEVSSTYLNVNGAIKVNGVAIPTAVALMYTAETEALTLTVS